MTTSSQINKKWMDGKRKNPESIVIQSSCTGVIHTQHHGLTTQNPCMGAVHVLDLASEVDKEVIFIGKRCRIERLDGNCICIV